MLVDIKDGIAWVTLNRPEKRNAISPALSEEMIATLDRLEPDPNVGVVVLTGAGNAYCAGMDLKEFFRATDKMTAEERAVFSRASATWQWRRLSYYMKPTIAMVNGWCFGAGFNSVIACDLAIAANEAVFGLSEINWGMIPAGNVMKSTVSVMNKRDSLYYTMTGETFDGKKAASMGMVNESVPLAKLKKRVTDLANVLLDEEPDNAAPGQACLQAHHRYGLGSHPRITSSRRSTRCGSSIPSKDASARCVSSSTRRPIGRDSAITSAKAETKRRRRLAPPFRLQRDFDQDGGLPISFQPPSG